MLPGPLLSKTLLATVFSQQPSLVDLAHCPQLYHGTRDSILISICESHCIQATIHSHGLVALQPGVNFKKLCAFFYSQTAMYKLTEFSRTYRVYMARPCGTVSEAGVLNCANLSHCCHAVLRCCHLACKCHSHRCFCIAAPSWGLRAVLIHHIPWLTFLCCSSCVRICVWQYRPKNVCVSHFRCECNWRSRAVYVPLVSFCTVIV